MHTAITVPDTVSVAALQRALLRHHSAMLKMQEMLNDLDLLEVERAHLACMNLPPPVDDQTGDELADLESTMYGELIDRMREIEGR
ncbi:MAG TPA: hypothetical protein V6D22_15010 [Candidatus Obscuribacterales bacterium]